MKQSILFVIIILLCPCWASAQIQSYNFYNLSTENGLPTDDYQSVYQDSFGFLWLASYDGLFRWDGYAFRKYYHDEKDAHSLSHNIVYSIFEDSKKQLWVGTIEGLNRYDRATDSFVKSNITYNNQIVPVNTIVEDSKQQLWLGTSNGLCLYDPDKDRVEWFTGQSSGDIIFCMALDKLDHIWAATFKGGLRKFSLSTREFQTFNTTTYGNGINSIMVDHNHNVWLGTTNRGIAVLNQNGEVIKHYTNFLNEKQFEQNPITSLYEDKNKTIWIGASRKTLHYITDLDHAPVKFNSSQFGGGKNKLISISAIHEDRFSNLWFATKGNGLFYTNFSKNVFKNFLQDPSQVKNLETDVITCMHEDTLSNIWLGTDRNGLLKFNPATNTFLLFTMETHGLSSNAINDIQDGRDGNIWISTWQGGIMKFNTKTSTVHTFRNNVKDINSLIFNDAKSILPDDTILWVGTHGEGIAAFDEKHKRFIHHKNNTIFPFQMNDPAWINHLFRDSKKRLWISTYSGLYIYDQKHLQNFRHSEDTLSISSNAVNMVTEDKYGTIWIITENGGLNQYDEKNHTFIRFRKKIELPTTMKSIIVDDKNNLWISSNEGIVMFDNKRLQVKKYDVSDGLNANSFFHKAALKTKTGRLYFGGPHGFTSFHPDSIKPVSVPSFFYFTNLYIDNEIQTPASTGSVLEKVLSFTKSLSLTYEQSSFSIEFASINLYSPAKTQYAYKLEGLRDQWVKLRTERKISFTGLEPGNYNLKIRYTNVDGSWRDAPEHLNIIILPPWWKTLWFKLLVSAFLIMVVIAVFYIRIASIRNRNIMLKSEVSKRTYELSEANAFLVERNEEIQHQKEKLEEYNEEVVRQSNKILTQQIHISAQNHTLESTVEELQKLNKTKDHFFSILAHDLKNPVSALTGISDFMISNFARLEKKEAEQYLNSVHKASHAVYDLLVNLLNWAQTQSKNIEYTPLDFSIRDILYKNATLLEQQLTNKHITLSIKVDAMHHVYADYNMIDVIMRNILSNSVKFTEYNGRIDVSSELNDNDVIICVTDNGAGMTKLQIEKLFSLDKGNISTGTAGEKGTGLGLVITQEFIHINKGQLHIDSTPGKGSSFYITLPKATPTANHAGKKLKNGHTNEKLVLDFWESFPADKLMWIKGRKLLIIDDNKELRNYLRMILSSTFEIFEAENGSEGLKMAQEVQPAVIISDLVMPVMNGLEFSRAVKNSTATSHIPVVLLTSSSEQESQMAGYEAGIDVFLSKPIKKEMLFQVIINLLQNQEKIRERMRESILDRKTLYQEESSISKLDQEFLTNLIAFIEKDISAQYIDAKSICEHLGISRTALYTKIKTLTGQSVHEFIKSIRLKRSLALLIEGKLNISQIAHEVGFNSHSYFNKCFIRQYGLGPREYIKKKGKSGFTHSSDT
jgi:ligand-binding sensor domain-containing protein/signal transduction histidine kinase/CheY-like chemotaxis protein/AraC-like DNA-binding protein